MDQEWIRNGSGMDQEWIRNGSGMDQEWTIFKSWIT